MTSLSVPGFLFLSIFFVIYAGLKMNGVSREREKQHVYISTPRVDLQLLVFPLIVPFLLVASMYFRSLSLLLFVVFAEQAGFFYFRTFSKNKKDDYELAFLTFFVSFVVLGAIAGVSYSVFQAIR